MGKGEVVRSSKVEREREVFRVLLADCCLAKGRFICYGAEERKGELAGRVIGVKERRRRGETVEV